MAGAGATAGATAGGSAEGSVGSGRGGAGCRARPAEPYAQKASALMKEAVVRGEARPEKSADGPPVRTVADQTAERPPRRAAPGCCMRTRMVSNGWPTTTPTVPPIAPAD